MTVTSLDRPNQSGSTWPVHVHFNSQLRVISIDINIMDDRIPSRFVWIVKSCNNNPEHTCCRWWMQKVSQLTRKTGAPPTIIPEPNAVDGSIKKMFCSITFAAKPGRTLSCSLRSRLRSEREFLGNLERSSSATRLKEAAKWASARTLTSFF